MAIPESQLEIWAKQGSVTQSASTYKKIKSALESSATPYYSKDYSVFLQGSYGNDTNVYSESDVDIIIKLNSCFFHNIAELSENQVSLFNSTHSGASYNYFDFKKDVIIILEKKYGDLIDIADKAITIAANGSRRSADVIVSVAYRRYSHFQGIQNQNFVDGICFFNKLGQLIINYPKQHSIKCTIKHQSSDYWFKPMVRILKNLRNRLLVKELIDPGSAPSYYLEGLLYNVPNDKFGYNYEKTFMNSMNWLLESDRSDFVCANEQYYLLRDGNLVSWTAQNCSKFLDAAVKLWNEW